MAKSPKGMNKSELYAEVAAATELNKNQVRAVLQALQAVVVKQLTKKAGKIIIPGLMRFTIKKIKAQKGGQTKKNPFTGEDYVTKDRPASVKVKAFPVKALNDAVKGTK